MRRSKFFIILFLLVCCCGRGFAQDSEYVFKDSSLLIADSIATKNLLVEMQKKNQPAEEEDTLLQNNKLSVINDSAEALKNSPPFAYAKDLDSMLKAIKDEQQAEPAPVRSEPSWLEKFFFSSVTKIFFWALAIFFVGFILYKLFFTEGIFQRRSTSNKVAVLPAEEEQLTSTTDYTKLIAQAVGNKNYRLATRYHYLQVLQKLASKDAIQFTADKTNYQYVHELYDKPYKNNFITLTLNYEYAWYGGFDISEAMFARIQNNFIAFNNQL